MSRGRRIQNVRAQQDWFGQEGQARGSRPLHTTRASRLLATRRWHLFLPPSPVGPAQDPVWKLLKAGSRVRTGGPTDAQCNVPEPGGDPSRWQMGQLEGGACSQLCYRSANIYMTFEGTRISHHRPYRPYRWEQQQRGEPLDLTSSHHPEDPGPQDEAGRGAASAVGACRVLRAGHWEDS